MFKPFALLALILGTFSAQAYTRETMADFFACYAPRETVCENNADEMLAKGVSWQSMEVHRRACLALASSACEEEADLKLGERRRRQN